MEEAHEKPRETAFMMNKCKLEMGLRLWDRERPFFWGLKAGGQATATNDGIEIGKANRGKLK